MLVLLGLATWAMSSAISIATSAPWRWLGSAFAWDQLQQVSPRLVYRSVQGYGQNSPLANRPAFNDITQGDCGLVSLEVATGSDARFVPTLIGDKPVGLTMVYAMLATLLQRAHTGGDSASIRARSCARFAKPEIADLFAREIAIEAGSG